MFIRALTLKNVLSFRAPEPLELGPLNILIGPNAAGKTNLLSCIELLQALPNSLNNYLNSRGGADAWVWKGAKSTQEPARLEYQFRIEPHSLNYQLAFASVERALAVQEEMLSQSDYSYLTRRGVRLQVGSRGLPGVPDSERETNIVPTQSVLETFRSPLDPTPITPTARAFGEIRIYGGFDTGTRSDARIGTSTGGSPKHPLEASGSNLALALQEMDFQGSLAKVKEYLKRFSARFEDIKIRSEGGRSQVYVTERGVGRLSATNLSDGTLKFLCLMAVLFDDDPPPLVCIDEPEAGLHPDALALVGSALREASQRMQIVVATHSDALVDQFSDEPENIIVCERGSDEGTQFSRLSRLQLREWLQDYTLGDLWRRGEIGGMQR